MVSGIESNSDRSRVVDGIMDPMRRRKRCLRGGTGSIGVMFVLILVKAKLGSRNYVGFLGPVASRIRG